MSVRRMGGRAGFVAPTLVCLLAAGCGRKVPASSETHSTSETAPISSSSTDEYDYDDPCSLLEPSEVEAVLGGKLAVPPFRSGGDPDDPRVDGEDCIYETADFHVITLSVDFTDGAPAFGMMNFGNKLLGSAPAQFKQAFKSADGSELTGQWDKATLLPMNCCDFAALRGDQLIEIDFTATNATLGQAMTLVNAAFGRMGKPLAIDGGAHVDEAAALAKTRPRPVDPCSVLSRAEAEAILGPLASDPTPNGTDECDYQVPSQGPPAIYNLRFTWRGGFHDFRSNGHVADVASDALAVNVSGERNDTLEEKTIRLDLTQSVSDTGSWERAGIVGMDFAAVKKDVLVTVALQGIDRAKAAKLVAAAMRKL